ncbi:MAG: gamma-glutamylcyclotransferase [Verrucomicrobia bacterium]|nr:gamma-glutamylcyclotransferase [Verrucomicrobiota bacterium]
MNEKCLYFIYGTLLRGCSNYHRFGFSKEARFVRAAVLHGARMYDLGGYPCIVLSGSSEDSVHGELYELPIGKCQNSITAMELGAGCTEKCVVLERVRAVSFVYETAPAHAPRIVDGVWRETL